MAVTWTEDDIARLKALIATGATRGHFENRDLSLRPQDDLLKLLEIMQGEIASADTGRTRQVRFTTDKGL